MENILTYKIYSIILFGEKAKILSYINFLYGPKHPLFKDLRFDKKLKIYTN